MSANPPSNAYAREISRHMPTQQKEQRQDTDTYLAQQLEIARRTPLTVLDPNDDPAFVAKIKHTMLPDEKLMEWIARVGCSRAEAFSFSSEELSAFVERAIKNAIEDTTGSSSAWRPKATVPKFLQV